MLLVLKLVLVAWKAMVSPAETATLCPVIDAVTRLVPLGGVMLWVSAVAEPLRKSVMIMGEVNDPDDPL